MSPYLLFGVEASYYAAKIAKQFQAWLEPLGVRPTRYTTVEQDYLDFMLICGAIRHQTSSCRPMPRGW